MLEDLEPRLDSPPSEPVVALANTYSPSPVQSVNPLTNSKYFPHGQSRSLLIFKYPVASDRSAHTQSIFDLPLELRLRIYKHYTDAALRNLTVCSDGIDLHVPPGGQVCSEMRVEIWKRYLEAVSWRVDLSNKEGLQKSMAWVKALGKDARYLTRFTLVFVRRSYAEISLGADTHCNFYYESVLAQESWVKDYLEMNIMQPWMKRRQRGTIRGTHIVDMLGTVAMVLRRLFLRPEDR